MIAPAEDGVVEQVLLRLLPLIGAADVLENVLGSRVKEVRRFLVNVFFVAIGLGFRHGLSISAIIWGAIITNDRTTSPIPKHWCGCNPVTDYLQPTRKPGASRSAKRKRYRLGFNA